MLGTSHNCLEKAKSAPTRIPIMKIKLFILLVLLLTASNQLAGQDFKELKSIKDPRAKGLDFKLRYPSNWKELQPERPNVVKKFTNASGSVGMVVLIKKLPGNPTGEEVEFLRSTLSSSKALASIPGRSKFLAGSSKTMIDNLPASTLEYISVARVLDTDLVTRGIRYTVFYKDNYIIISFHSESQNPKETMQNYYANELIFKRIAASFVLLTKYY